MTSFPDILRIAGTAELATDEPSGAERRSSLRVPYSETVRVAPYNGQIPPSQEFVDVVARDISPVGIGFSTQDFPASEMVVLRFGDGPNAQFMSARVVYFSAEDTSGFLIGCEYISRLHTVGTSQPEA